MIGTIIGHLIGSEYSRSEMKSTLRIRERDPIVDTICLIAICKTFTETGITDLIELSEAIKSNIQKYTGLYSESKDQMMNSILPSYFNNNNVGIQVPPVAWVATTVEEALLISDCVTATTANCPEAIKEARAITFAIFLARHGTEKDKIRQSIQQRFYPSISCFTSRNSIMRQKLAGEEVALAIIAFLESDSFEGAISNALRMEEDTASTLAAITGAIAEAYYGVPNELKEIALLSMDHNFATVIRQFEQKYQSYCDKSYGN